MRYLGLELILLLFLLSILEAADALADQKAKHAELDQKHYIIENELVRKTAELAYVRGQLNKVRAKAEEVDKDEAAARTRATEVQLAVDRTKAQIDRLAEPDFEEAQALTRIGELYLRVRQTKVACAELNSQRVQIEQAAQAQADAQSELSRLDQTAAKHEKAIRVARDAREKVQWEARTVREEMANLRVESDKAQQDGLREAEARRLRARLGEAKERRTGAERAHAALGEQVNALVAEVSSQAQKDQLRRGEYHVQNGHITRLRKLTRAC